MFITYICDGSLTVLTEYNGRYVLTKLIFLAFVCSLGFFLCHSFVFPFTFYPSSSSSSLCLLAISISIILFYVLGKMVCGCPSMLSETCIRFHMWNEDKQYQILSTILLRLLLLKLVIWYFIYTYFCPQYWFLFIYLFLYFFSVSVLLNASCTTGAECHCAMYGGGSAAAARARAAKETAATAIRFHSIGIPNATRPYP